MMLSLNEVAGTVLKAARGAGIPLGQAEDCAQIASYLIGIGGDPAVITQALKEPVTPAEVDWDVEEMRVLAGSAVMVAAVVRDAFTMGYDTVTISDPAHRSFIGAALAEQGVALTWDDLTIRRSDTEVLRPRIGAVTIPQADWSVWQTLAARTYVPESDASRLAGAGAGLTDND